MVGSRGTTGWRQLAQLVVGLAMFGASLAMMVRAELGLGPWDVLHQGIAIDLHVAIGWVVIGASAAVLVAWIPLRQRPGVGTLLNAVLVGLFTNVTLALLPPQHNDMVRVGLLTFGVFLNAAATAMYVGAGLGAGPRDGLMFGVAERAHLSIRRSRTLIELAALGVGWVLGGTVGVGTAVYALGIGPLVHLMLRGRSQPNQHRATRNGADRCPAHS